MDTHSSAVPPLLPPGAADPSTAAAAAGAGRDDLAPDTGRRFDRATTFRFGAGFLLFGLLWIIGLMTISAVLLPQRLKDIGVSSPETLLGSINAVTAVVSLVSNLVFGNFSDRTRGRLGRRTPWVVGGGLLGGAAMLSMGLVDSAGLITLLYCVAMVGLNMMLAPAVAVLSDRVPGRLRGTMSAFYGTGLSVGAPLGTLVGAALITSGLTGFVLGGVLMAVSALVAVVLWPRERPATDLPAVPTTLKDVLVSFRPPRNAPDFYKAFVGRLFMLVSYQMISAYQLYIVQDHLGQSTARSAATLATMSVITLVVSLLGSLVSGPVSDLIGRRKLPVVLSSVLFAVGIAMPWVWPTSAGMFAYAAIAGLGYGVYTSVDQALNVDVLPNQADAGKDLGILNLSTTAGQTVGPLITSSLVVATGGYGLVFPVAIVMALLGAFAITRIRAVR